jgi:hypothetical protein
MQGRRKELRSAPTDTIRVVSFSCRRAVRAEPSRKRWLLQSEILRGESEENTNDAVPGRKVGLRPQRGD